MTIGLNELIGEKFAKMAYFADKLGQTINFEETPTLRDIFYDDQGNLREFKDKDGNLHAE